MRRDKIYNFLSIRNFTGVDAVFLVHYEQQVKKGTGPLLAKIERALGVNATCRPAEPHSLTARPLPYKYVNWMQAHVDWEAESRIGYKFEWDWNAEAYKIQYAKAKNNDEQTSEEDIGEDEDDQGDTTSEPDTDDDNSSVSSIEYKMVKTS